MNKISSDRPDIKYIIVDDATFIMTQEFMQRAHETGFGKFTDIGQHMFFVLQAAKKLRDDIRVIFMFLEDYDAPEGLNPKKKIKTVGNAVDNYFDPQALTEVTLYTYITEQDGKRTYNFLTNNFNNIPAKTPLGMFDSILIPNDLNQVLTIMNDFYSKS